MKLTILDVQQRSPEWYKARAGLVTASSVGSLISINPPDAITVDCPTCSAAAGSPCLSRAAKKEPTPIKSMHDARTAATADLPPVYGPADNETSRNLLATLAAERITGHVEETRMTADMWRGVDAEPYARSEYAEHIGLPVDECGFMVADFGDFSIGYSPDALVGDEGLLECKAPRQKGHLLAVVNDEVPPFYMAQLQTGLLVSERKWIDYQPYVGGMRLWTKRVYPDPDWQGAILAVAERAEREIADLIDRYEQAVIGLPLTERIDFNTVELKGIA